MDMEKKIIKEKEYLFLHQGCEQKTEGRRTSYAGLQLLTNLWLSPCPGILTPGTLNNTTTLDLATEFCELL
jgi:hypothetical protein